MNFETAVNAKKTIESDRSGELQKMETKLGVNLKVVIAPYLTKDFLKFLRGYEEHSESSDQYARECSSSEQFIVIALYWKDHELHFDLFP